MCAQLLAWPVHFFDFIGFSHSYAHPQMVISVLGRVQSSNGCPPDVEVLNNEAAGQQQPTPVKQDTHPQQQPTSEMTLRRLLSSSVQAGTPAGTPVEFKSSNSGEVQPAGRAPGVAAVLECWDRAHPCARVLAGRTVPDPV